MKFIDKCTEEEKLTFHKVLTCLALDACKTYGTDSFNAETTQTFIMDDNTEKSWNFKFLVKILSIDSVD